MKLYVGMKFKPLSEPDIFGECVSLSEGRFTYRWFSATGEPGLDIRDMSVKDAIACFEYYGWVVLSELDRELL